MVDEGCQSPAECPGVLLAQIDLILGAADRESHCLIRRATIKIVF
jgi:hypothetical protein